MLAKPQGAAGCRHPPTAKVPHPRGRGPRRPTWERTVTLHAAALRRVAELGGVEKPLAADE
jgi:hypothetical protein